MEHGSELDAPLEMVPMSSPVVAARIRACLRNRPKIGAQCGFRAGTEAKSNSYRLSAFVTDASEGRDRTSMTSWSTANHRILPFM
jgi:hypothetical protein